MVVGSRDIGGFLHSLDSLIELKPYKKSGVFLGDPGDIPSEDGIRGYSQISIDLWMFLFHEIRRDGRGWTQAYARLESS